MVSISEKSEHLPSKESHQLKILKYQAMMSIDKNLSGYQKKMGSGWIYNLSNQEMPGDPVYNAQKCYEMAKATEQIPFDFKNAD